MALICSGSKGIIKNTFIHFQPETVPALATSPRSSSCPAMGEQVMHTEDFAVSVGSALHFSAECKPCAWRWRSGGCSKGHLCPFCHLCEDGAVQRKKRKKIKDLRARRAMDWAHSRLAYQNRVRRRGASISRQQAEHHVRSATSRASDREPSRNRGASQRRSSRSRPVSLQNVSIDVLLSEVQRRVECEQEDCRCATATACALPRRDMSQHRRSNASPVRVALPRAAPSPPWSFRPPTDAGLDASSTESGASATTTSRTGSCSSADGVCYQ